VHSSIDTKAEYRGNIIYHVEAWSLVPGVLVALVALLLANFQSLFSCLSLRVSKSHRQEINLSR